MKKENTVKSHREFDQIIHHGIRIKSDNFVCFAQKSELDHTRIGIAVGKSNGGAVMRVRIKRQVRSMIAKRNDYSLPINLIIVVRPSFSPDRFAELENELNGALDTIKDQLN